MDSIKKIIPDVIDQLTIKKGASLDKIYRVWQHALNKIDSAHSIVYGIKDDVLIVHVDSSARLFKLKWRKKYYLKVINEEIPQIKDIVFKIGKVK